MHGDADVFLKRGVVMVASANRANVGCKHAQKAVVSAQAGAKFNPLEDPGVAVAPYLVKENRHCYVPQLNDGVSVGFKPATDSYALWEDDFMPREL
jgi:hypothetical protein